MALHRHHKIPRHAGGSDDESNIEFLTIEQHAEAHRVLFEQHGRWQDKCAWLLLSGQITAGEAATEAARRVNLGRPKSLSHRLKLSAAKKGKKMSVKARDSMRRAQLGRKHTDETRQKIGASNRGKKVERSAVEQSIISRQKTDGRIVVVEGVEYPSHSAAAHVLKEVWGTTL